MPNSQLTAPNVNGLCTVKLLSRGLHYWLVKLPGARFPIADIVVVPLHVNQSSSQGHYGPHCRSIGHPNGTQILLAKLTLASGGCPNRIRSNRSDTLFHAWINQTCVRQLKNNLIITSPSVVVCIATRPPPCDPTRPKLMIVFRSTHDLKSVACFHSTAIDGICRTIACERATPKID